MSTDIGVTLFFFQAEDGIRDLVRSRGLGDVYKRQLHAAMVSRIKIMANLDIAEKRMPQDGRITIRIAAVSYTHLTLPTSDLV